MRPRIEIDALDVDTPADEVIGAVAMAGFSRLPIHEGDLDHIIGFVYTKDLLLRQHMGWPIELRKLVRPALLVPESLRIDKLLERFRQKRTQMAIVLDEFGGTEGLVTMEDVLEELVGEIHDEHRVERPQQIVARDESSWFVDAGLPLHELLERMEMTDRRVAAGRRVYGRGAGAFPAGANPRDGRLRCLGGVDVGGRGHGGAAAGTNSDLPDRLNGPPHSEHFADQIADFPRAVAHLAGGLALHLRAGDACMACITRWPALG